MLTRNTPKGGSRKQKLNNKIQKPTTTKTNKTTKRKAASVIASPFTTLTNTSALENENTVNDPAISKYIPEPLMTKNYKDPILNRHHTPHTTTPGGTTLQNLQSGVGTINHTTFTPGKQRQVDVYDEFSFDKYGQDASLHVDENMYDISKANLKEKIVKKPMEQLQPLINTLLPKGSPLDEYSYLRIRKMAKTNPDLIAMNENKLNTRLQQLSKIVLHPSFYTAYSSRYVFRKHQIPSTVPEDSVMNDKMNKYLEKKAIDLKSGKNEPNQEIEKSIKNYKKLHQYPFHPLVLHVFEKYPLILRRKHIEDTPALIENIFSTIQSEGAESLYKDIGDYDDDVGYSPNQSLKLNFDDDDYFNQNNTNFDNFNDDFSTKKKQSKKKSQIDAYEILGKFPKLLEFDLTNRIHEKLNSFTTIICAFLAQDQLNHNNLYTREDISQAQQIVFEFIISQPDILKANIHNIIPKRLNFIQKACLFSSAKETLEYLSKNPRLLSPTINPSNIQRLSLLRLKPPRFDHITTENLQNLGFEAQFALDMLKKLVALTPYPELSKIPELPRFSSKHDRNEALHKKKLLQNNDFESFITGKAGDLGAITVGEHNELEDLYEGFSQSWAEYLEDVSGLEQGPKLSASLSGQKQPRSLENGGEVNFQNNFDLGLSDDNLNQNNNNDGHNNNTSNFDPKKQLKLDMIPLLVLMHNKTFSTLFPDYVNARKKGQTHRQNQLSSPTQYNRFLDGATPNSNRNPDFDQNNSDESSLQFTQQSTISGSQLRKQQQEQRIDDMLSGNMNKNQKPRTIITHENDLIDQDEVYDFDFDSAQTSIKPSIPPEKPRLPTERLRVKPTHGEPPIEAATRTDIAATFQEAQVFIPDDDMELIGRTYIDAHKEQIIMEDEYSVDFGTFDYEIQTTPTKGHSATRIAPTREIGDAVDITLDKVSADRFARAQQKVSQRDAAREKEHRYRGKGGQFFELGRSKEVQITDEDILGEFGVKLNRDDNQQIIEAFSNRTTGGDGGNVDEFENEQMKYIHKNKLQKQSVREKRRTAAHEEDDLRQEAEFYSPSVEIAKAVGTAIKRVEKHLHEDHEPILGPVDTDILVKSANKHKHSKNVKTYKNQQDNDDEDEFVLYGVDIDELMDGDYGSKMVGVTSKPQSSVNAHVIDAATISQQKFGEESGFTREDLQDFEAKINTNLNEHVNNVVDAQEKQQKKRKARKLPHMTEYESKWAGGSKKGARVM
jgi:hypothetical protein